MRDVRRCEALCAPNAASCAQGLGVSCASIERAAAYHIHHRSIVFDWRVTGATGDSEWCTLVSVSCVHCINISIHIYASLYIVYIYVCITVRMNGAVAANKQDALLDA